LLFPGSAPGFATLVALIEKTPDSLLDKVSSEFNQRQNYKYEQQNDGKPDSSLSRAAPQFPFA
jgi:hypothetical protein